MKKIVCTLLFMGFIAIVFGQKKYEITANLFYFSTNQFSYTDSQFATISFRKGIQSLNGTIGVDKYFNSGRYISTAFGFSKNESADSTYILPLNKLDGYVKQSDRNANFYAHIGAGKKMEIHKKYFLSSAVLLTYLNTKRTTDYYFASFDSIGMRDSSYNVKFYPKTHNIQIQSRNIIQFMPVKNLFLGVVLLPTIGLKFQTEDRVTYSIDYNNVRTEQPKISNSVIKYRANYQLYFYFLFGCQISYAF